MTDDSSKKRRERKDSLRESADPKAAARGVYKTMQVPEEAPAEPLKPVKDDGSGGGSGPFGSH